MRVLGGAVLVLISGCGGASSDPGIRALVQVAGAQFVPGAMPSTGTGPSVVSVTNTRTVVIPGEREKPLRGAVDLSAKSVAIGMPKDLGYWIVPSAPPSFEVPNYLSFDVQLDFSRQIPDGAFEVDVRAGDGVGNFGGAASVSYVAQALAAPNGNLVFTLRWDTDADLDIHVIDPTGAEIWARNINSFPKPRVGEMPDPMAVLSGGILDFDSNAECVIDGRREENVVYMVTPPSGHYLVRVDAFSMCGQSAAHWTVEARHMDQVFARSGGTATDADTRFSHDRGAGVLALEIDQP